MSFVCLFSSCSFSCRADSVSSVRAAAVVTKVVTRGWPWRAPLFETNEVVSLPTPPFYQPVQPLRWSLAFRTLAQVESFPNSSQFWANRD
jgi:hypothetical protein